MRKVFSLLIFLLFLQTGFAQTETSTQTQILDFSVIISVIIVLGFIVLFVLIAIAIIGLVYYIGFRGTTPQQQKLVIRDSEPSIPRISLAPKKEEEKEPEKIILKPIEKPLPKGTQEKETQPIPYKDLELDDSPNLSNEKPLEEKQVIQEKKEEQPRKLFSFGWKAKTEIEAKPMESISLEKQNLQKKEEKHFEEKVEETEEKIFEAKPIIETEEEKEKSKISKSLLDRLKIKK